MLFTALGFACGLLLCIAYTWHIFRQLFLASYKAARALPKKVRPKTLNAAILAQIRSQTSPSSEGMEWSNMLIAWLYGVIENSPLLREATFERAFKQMAVDMRRSRLGPYLLDCTLKDIKIGSKMPIIRDISILTSGKKSSSQSLPLSFRLNFSYSGDLAGILLMETVFGFPIWFQVAVDEIAGPMLAIIEENVFYYTFESFTKLSFRSRVNIGGRSSSNSSSNSSSSSWGGGYEFQILNWLVNRWLLPWYFCRKFQFPVMRSKWIINKPNQPPYPWDPAVQSDPELLYNWQPPSS